MAFTKIDYEEYFDPTQKYSEFWKLNPNGFCGQKEDKEGFILGPSIFGINSDDNKDIKSTCEIFSPTVYIKSKVFGCKAQKTAFK